MKLSPILGLPIAEPEDFATDYPVEIDEPRTLALDSIVISGDIGINTDYISTTRLQLISFNGVTDTSGFILVPFMHMIVINQYVVVTYSLFCPFDWVSRLDAVSPYDARVRVFDPGNGSGVANAGVNIQMMVAATLA